MDSPDKHPPQKFSRRKLAQVLGRLGMVSLGLGALGLAANSLRGKPRSEGNTQDALPAPVLPTSVPHARENILPTAEVAKVRQGYVDGQIREVPTLTHPIDNHYRHKVDRVPGTTEITGTFPESKFHFYKDIKENGLVPAVFLNETTGQRIDRGVLYLAGIFDLLSKQPNLSGPKLRELGINTADNLPLNFPPDATLYDVLAGFISSFAHKNVDFNPVPEHGDGYIFGTIGEPFFADGLWRLKAKTKLDMSLLDEKENREENNTAYYQTTNLQFALRQLHEYIHLNQDEALMVEIVKDPVLMNQIGQDSGKMRAAIERKAVEHKERVIRQNGLAPNSQPNEAQANAISQLLLYTLSRINRNTERFPGAEGDDPYPISDASLQRDFRRNVLATGALNPDWQVRHTK
jgi:hypothetical protein